MFFKELFKGLLRCDVILKSLNDTSGPYGTRRLHHGRDMETMIYSNKLVSITLKKCYHNCNRFLIVSNLVKRDEYMSFKQKSYNLIIVINSVNEYMIFPLNEDHRS